MMDVPPDNALPDPYGGAAQAAYPWRGRITCHPGPMQPGSADRTAAVRAEVEAFCGAAGPGDFAALPDTIAFNGEPDEWSYRRFLLHFAHLAAAAGGVDGFLIGTELRGLTTLRDAENAFPFVEALCALADEVRGILGPTTEITYGADWSEYFGHQPADGSGDVFFHLDPLWSHPDIAAVGIDNYMPLSDWRDSDYGGGNPDGFETPYDLHGLTAAIAGGEGFDWYYPSVEARAARERAPISDGSGKPWVYRYKDLVGWWSNPHFNRIGGVEVATPTAWQPRSKPIRFTELGCPTVDKGPNQPNVFPDPKSSESASPYFSSGGRSDIAQRRFLEAHQLYWDPDLPGFEDTRNPMSPVYGGRMLDHTRTLIWSWDARPFPAFPLRGDEWRDGENWHLGHWLNGRLDASSCSDLIDAILADHGQEPADTVHAEGTVQGYVIHDPSTARAALEPITELFGIVAVDEPERLVFRLAGAGVGSALAIRDMALHEGAALDIVRTPDHELPREAVLASREPFLDYQATAPRSRRLGAAGSRQQAIGFPGTLETGQAQALLDDWIRRLWTERERISFSLAPADVAAEPGTIIRLPDASNADFLVTKVEEGLLRTVDARQIARTAPTRWRGGARQSGVPAPPILAGKPDVHLLDLPMGSEQAAPETRFRIAAWQKPWRSQAVYSSADTSGFTLRAHLTTPAIIGRLVEPLDGAGFEGRIDRGTTVAVKLSSGELASVSRLQLLNGANAAAIRSNAGAWEIVQFESAEETAPDVWRLGKLLRGQAGTSDAMAAGANAGAVFVLLDQAVVPAGLAAGEAGLERNWRIGPVGHEITPAHFAELAAAGGLRAQLPLSPVHLRARKSGSDLVFSWVRRGRLSADDWQQVDVPLGEAAEEYRIEIAPPGGAVVRTAASGTTTWTYAAAAIAADFGSMPTELDLTVRQLSAAVGWGIPATRRIATR